MEKMPFDVPIYLNQKVVFDLIASLHDGFTNVTRIKTTAGNQESASAGIDADLGNKNIFAFLGVNFSGKVSRDNTDQKEMEKVHTPSSLFNELKKELIHNDHVKIISDKGSFEKIQPGDFVEIRGQVIKNPLVKMFENIQKMMELATVMQDYQKGQKGKQEKDSDKRTIGQIKAFTSSLQNHNMVDLICESNQEYAFSAVMPVYLDYFFNENMNEIVDGEFKVFGKVTSICKEDSGKSIDLMRNTGFTILRQSMVDEIIKSLDADDETLNLERVKTFIAAPAILIIPIGIYI